MRRLRWLCAHNGRRRGAHKHLHKPDAIDAMLRLESLTHRTPAQTLFALFFWRRSSSDDSSAGFSWAAGFAAGALCDARE